MSFLRAKDYLKKFSLDKNIIELDVSTATVDDAANAIKCKKDEIVKTLSFIIDNKPILICVSGDSKVDNGKFKNEFYTKAKMIPPEDVERLIGHDVGGVCPFGINDDVDVFFDVSLKDKSFIYPACGNSNSVVKLELSNLEEIINYKKWVDISKKWIKNR